MIDLVNDVRALWWEPADYDLFREGATILARAEAPDPSEEEEAHHTLCAGTTTPMDSRDSNEDGCCSTENGSRSVDDEDNKGWWCDLGHSRRGIEKFTHKTLACQRIAATISFLPNQLHRRRYGVGSRNQPGGSFYVNINYTLLSSL